MSKIAQYLSEHILGEVITTPTVRQVLSTDASLLTMTPEIVVYPKVTNDIRKVARFTWQLAEKGHIFPLTVRGGGSDQTGAAIGKGIMIVTPAHMHQIFELDPKQKLVRVQPGVMFGALNQALSLHSLMIPSYPSSANYSTLGGAIANNASGVLSGSYGDTAQWVSQLEVVLASGDLLQTGRISKKELNHKKGLQTFEGEIYRKIDGLIEDNKEIIASKVASDVRDNAGYSGITEVKRKDGSLDLTPLFLASQGTLGIISEVIMKTMLGGGPHTSVGLAAFGDVEALRDAIDDLTGLEPAMLELIDGELLAEATARGRQYSFYDESVRGGAVLLFAFDQFSEHARTRSIKKAAKLMEARGGTVIIAHTADEAIALSSIRDMTALLLSPDTPDNSLPPILDGAYVPLERLEDFLVAVKNLAVKYRVTLPLYGHALESVFYTRPTLQLKKVGDKQKIFKLLDEYAALVTAHGGHLIGEASEGRFKAPFAYKYIEDDVLDLFAQIKAIFDPYGTLNPGVKQPAELKDLVAYLRSDYDLSAFVRDLPAN